MYWLVNARTGQLASFDALVSNLQLVVVRLTDPKDSIGIRARTCHVGLSFVDVPSGPLAPSLVALPFASPLKPR